MDFLPNVFPVEPPPRFISPGDSCLQNSKYYVVFMKMSPSLVVLIHGSFRLLKVDCCIFVTADIAAILLLSFCNISLCTAAISSRLYL